MSAIRKFINSETSSGVLLLFAALLAIAIDNSPLAHLYSQLLNTNFLVQVGQYGLDKPILLWINDGLMAIFFLLIGLEIKREFLAGELSSRDQIILPAMAAFGGMAMPALIYSAINWGDADLIRGWAIPAATDIAFALGILALLGKRIPLSLKVFLMTLAILDDVGAIVIIAAFYTDAVSLTYIGLAALSLGALFALNRTGVTRIVPFILIGAVLWVLILKSGIHATLAGVLLALFIPMKPGQANSPLEKLEHTLHPYVAYFIMPVFAFANAGVSFEDFTFSALLGGLPLGIAAGLVLGNQIGVMGMTWLVVKMKLASLPNGTGWGHIYGVACLAGVGFTMSLFIGMLAFEDQAHAAGVRFGVMSASLVAGIMGYTVLRLLKYEGK